MTKWEFCWQHWCAISRNIVADTPTFHDDCSLCSHFSSALIVVVQQTDSAMCVLLAHQRSKSIHTKHMHALATACVQRESTPADTSLLVTCSRQQTSVSDVRAQFLEAHVILCTCTRNDVMPCHTALSTRCHQPPACV